MWSRPSPSPPRAQIWCLFSSRVTSEKSTVCRRHCNCGPLFCGRKIAAPLAHLFLGNSRFPLIGDIFLSVVSCAPFPPSHCSALLLNTHYSKNGFPAFASASQWTPYLCCPFQNAQPTPAPTRSVIPKKVEASYQTLSSLPFFPFPFRLPPV